MQNGITNGASRPPVVDRTPIYRSRAFKAKFLAIAVVCVMIISALAMVLPAIIASPANNIPASIAANNGQREVYWNYSDLFHMKFQDWNWNRSGGVTFEVAGHHESNPTNKFPDRMPTWYLMREPNYGEYIYRQEYPHIWYYNPYSTQTTPDVSVGWIAYAPMSEGIWARNVTDFKTKTDALFVPDLDATYTNDGWINASYYQTYISPSEMAAMKAVATWQSHYSYWLYGLSTRVNFNDDGYWAQLMGKIEYSRLAAMSYLGWDGTGDVRTWFTANDATLEGLWFDDWMAEGSEGGAYDTYTAYDYPNDIRRLNLQLDSINSTDSKLVIREYSISWGMDALMNRYLEAGNIAKQIGQGWMEDMDLKVKVSPNMANVSLSAVVNYVLTLSEDSDDSTWMSGWQIETQHMDWAGNTATHTTYNSPYNRYDPDQVAILKESRSPWTVNFDKQVSYWIAPREQDLATYENIRVSLPTTDVLCFRPNSAVVADEARLTYLANLQANQYWGRMALGEGSWPYANISNAYNPVTKSLWLKGAQNFQNETQAGDPSALMYGVPMFQFDVSPVSYFDVSVTSNRTTTETDGITITARNGTGALTPTWWNGTVVLSKTDGAASWGAKGSQHTFSAGDNAKWSTSITWATAGIQYVNASDQNFTADITGTSGPLSISLIPEFSTLLIPMVGAIAIFLVFRTKRRRKTE